MFSFQFAYSPVFIVGIPVLLVLLFFKFRKKFAPVYRFSLASELGQSGFKKGQWKSAVLLFLRFLTLFVLLLLVARPQLVDHSSKVNVQGIDIVLAIDVSGSMELYDDQKDLRTRINVVKAEAESFVKKRVNDQIGIVVFGADSLAMSPLTSDKKMLEKTIQELRVGTIDAHGTSLGRGLASSVLRLRGSEAKSKVIVLLTDGMPNSPSDVPIPKAIEMAKHYQIKIYSIGVGSSRPFAKTQFGFEFIRDFGFDPLLLKKISSETGGQYFHAKNPKELKTVYEKIDALEKRDIELDIYSRYYEFFWPFFIMACCLVFAEAVLTSLFWKGIAW